MLPAEPYENVHKMASVAVIYVRGCLNYVSSNYTCDVQLQFVCQRPKQYIICNIIYILAALILGNVLIYYTTSMLRELLNKLFCSRMTLQ